MSHLDVPLEPPVVFPEAGDVAPAQAVNRILEPDDIQREPFAGINRGIAALIAKEKQERGAQLSFVYPSKVWEYPWACARHAPPEGELVLDAGCGVSTLPIYLASQGATVVAIDNDIRWLTMEQRAAAFHGQPVVPVLMDMVGLGFPDETFDRVYCISVLEHIDPEQQPTAVQEMARVLKPGGVLYLTVDYDAAERRSGEDVVYDRTALQRNAIAPSGLVIEGSTRYGCDDWERQRQRMREFKLHTFASMAVTLRKPPAEGPESAIAIEARRAARPKAWTEVGDAAALGGLAAGAEQGLAVTVGGPWLEAHAARTALAAACHEKHPDAPVLATADAAAIIDGQLDGCGLDVYGVRFDAGLPDAAELTRVRDCVIVAEPADEGAARELAASRGYVGVWVAS